MTTDSILAIIGEIEALTPSQRRQLQRRLYASGLFVPEILYSDQNRLAVAPALAKPTPTPKATTKPVAPRAQTAPTVATPLPAVGRDKGDYRTPVSGKTVIGAPTTQKSDPDPHLMPPLPGQAPEQPIAIVFDGGSRGNPGQGYGSYALYWPGEPAHVVRLRFGNQATNNEAEYDTLITALEAILKRLRDAGADPKTARLDVRGDSLLVINQVQGIWQCKEVRLQSRCQQARTLLQQFGEWRLQHHARNKSVEVLGH
ncbi:MAG: reverse transcriptase-like protein [Caldilineaceae bacterium]|nr:reverse transcriptase-like protein [Caldilineaceae bacterium]